MKLVTAVIKPHKWEDVREAPRWRYVFGRRLGTATSAIASVKSTNVIVEVPS